MQMLRFAQHDSQFFHTFGAFPQIGAAKPQAAAYRTDRDLDKLEANSPLPH
jgi:hypothetical protein